MYERFVGYFDVVDVVVVEGGDFVGFYVEVEVVVGFVVGDVGGFRDGGLFGVARDLYDECVVGDVDGGEVIVFVFGYVCEVEEE